MVECNSRESFGIKCHGSSHQVESTMSRKWSGYEMDKFDCGPPMVKSKPLSLIHPISHVSQGGCMPMHSIASASNGTQRHA